MKKAILTVKHAITVAYDLIADCHLIATELEKPLSEERLIIAIGESVLLKRCS